MYNNIEIKNINDIEKEIKLGKYELLKDHDIEYKDHSLVRNKLAYNDYKNDLITHEKLSNCKCKKSL